ncbi:MAG TPA: MBL fold metallo-hydrolase RNA specificity domain-containing protein [Candidatus Limnocylindrales bacterium]|nr:MBL fold metallo-hydrolase RNA specificity domain-containing protein [Candidatus Limnocylindrales bacterium]
MRLRFLGAATTVTGSQFLLETDRARVLIDCGMFQGSPHEVERNRVPFSFEPRSLDAVVLTHAHLDHCGLLPMLEKQGFRGAIHLTRATAELAGLVLLDSGKIQVEQAKERRERDERHARRDTRRRATRMGRPGAGAPQLGEAVDEAAAAEQERRGRGRPWPPDDPQEPGFDPEEALRRQPPVAETVIHAPLYDVSDAERTIALFRGHDYEQPFEVAPGVRAVLRDAGHILGSAIVVVDAADEQGPARRIVFSGDLGRPGTPIIRDPTLIREGADHVLVESTYGGREHGPGSVAIDLLAEVVNAVADADGVLLVPSFAIGRTQEVVWALDRLLEAGRIPHVPLYLDSPMASHASDIYRAFPGYYDEETARLLHDGRTPLDYPGATVTRTGAESKAIKRAKRPLMIVASNGMLTGGRVVHHLRDLVGDPHATILFVGYQGEGTLGRHLQDGTRQVRLDGAWHEVRCGVRSIDGFSAHGDESELLDWLRPFAAADRRPRHVFAVHGDPEASAALATGIAQLGLPPYLPRWREAVELD